MLTVTPGPSPTPTATSGLPPTRLTGQIILPDPSKCPDCSRAGVDVVVFGLATNQPPIPIESFLTSGQGRYDTGDLTAALTDPANGSPDTNGDGKRTLIVVASVNASGAQIGGAVSLPTGSTVNRNFSPSSQVAAVAVTFLTTGTGASGPGCTVQATCGPSDQNCFTTADPDTIDQLTIQHLNQAAVFIASGVTFPDDVGRAACAVIICSHAGAKATTDGGQCVTAAFQGGP